jgi:23S rRNA (uridine2552-2'-O)-methyltransferase
MIKLNYCIISTKLNITSRFFSGNKAWISRHKNDKYVKAAVEGDLRSRSYFKLTEIQEKYNIIKRNDFVIDLGAAPGGWSLATSKIFSQYDIKFSDINKKYIPSTSLLCAVDLLPMDPISNTIIIQGDFNDSKVQDQLFFLSDKNGKADVVLSDMLQNASGHRSSDHFRSIELCLSALDFCETCLSKGGHFLCKFLRGSDDNELTDAAREMFTDVKIVKPKASRNESSEIYLLAMKKK